MLKKQDQNALLVGLGLVLLVMLITFFRGILFDSQNQATQEQTTESQAQTASGEKYQTITPTELQKKISLKEKINLLDIRDLETYASKHILDSNHVSVEKFPTESIINPANPTVIIATDLNDQNIENILKLLKEKHFTNVKVLAGGFSAWEKIIGAVVNYGDPTSFVDQAKVSYVENEKLNEAIKSKVPTFILDVRTPQEYAEGHLLNAVNIPFEDLEKRRGELSKYAKIVIVGINELQEFQAGVQLYDMLITQPFVLKEGIPGWKKKKFELVK